MSSIQLLCMHLHTSLRSWQLPHKPRRLIYRNCLSTTDNLLRSHKWLRQHVPESSSFARSWKWVSALVLARSLMRTLNLGASKGIGLTLCTALQLISWRRPCLYGFDCFVSCFAVHMPAVGLQRLLPNTQQTRGDQRTGSSSFGGGWACSYHCPRVVRHVRNTKTPMETTPCAARR